MKIIKGISSLFGSMKKDAVWNDIKIFYVFYILSIATILITYSEAKSFLLMFRIEDSDFSKIVAIGVSGLVSGYIICVFIYRLIYNDKNKSSNLGGKFECQCLSGRCALDPSYRPIFVGSQVRCIKTLDGLVTSGNTYIALSVDPKNNRIDVMGDGGDIVTVNAKRFLRDIIS